MSVAVFGYGSLVSSTSAAETLGGRTVQPQPATLLGWRRRFSLVRDNRRCEKTFARVDDGTIPDLVLALNVERDRGDGTGEAGRMGINGALIDVTAGELERLDCREGRYDRIDVTGEIAAAEGSTSFERVFTYIAKPEHLALEPPPGAVILTSYAGAVESAFAALGPGELDRYLGSTDPCAAERIDAVLVAGNIHPGNPRAW